MYSIITNSGLQLAQSALERMIEDEADLARFEAEETIRAEIRMDSLNEEIRRNMWLEFYRKEVYDGRSSETAKKVADAALASYDEQFTEGK